MLEMIVIFLLTSLNLFNLVSAFNKEFEFQSTGSSFALNGLYEQGDFAGKEFWLCIDYDSSSREELGFASDLKIKSGLLTKLLHGKIEATKLLEATKPNPYPADKCGGLMHASNNPYWFALHGVWKRDRVLEVRFVSAFEIWPETWSTSVKPIDHAFPLNENVLKRHSRHFANWKLIQSHGETSKGLKWPSISALDLDGSGKVDTLTPASGTIHVRLNGDGVQLNGYSLKLTNKASDPFDRFYEQLGEEK